MLETAQEPLPFCANLVKPTPRVDDLQQHGWPVSDDVHDILQGSVNKGIHLGLVGKRGILMFGKELGNLLHGDSVGIMEMKTEATPNGEKRVFRAPYTMIMQRSSLKFPDTTRDLMHHLPLTFLTK